MAKTRNSDLFDWDAGNSGKNLRSHAVSDEEAEQVFQNAPTVRLNDPIHSAEEMRLRILGKTDSGRMMFVSYTMRGTKYRVISARDMNKKERNLYEQETEKAA
ncbi:MAG TPA: BrnT family toxin [Candidatus Kapabacteria bacterium]|jgi:hypothetical protein